MSIWKTLKTKVVFETPWIKVRHDDVLTPAGSPAQYGVVEFKDVFNALVFARIGWRSHAVAHGVNLAAGVAERRFGIAAVANRELAAIFLDGVCAWVKSVVTTRGR